MRTITINIYNIDEHPNKEKCYEWIRNNDYHIGDFEIDELRLTLDKLSEHIGGTVDYCLSHYPDRSEHIIFKDYDEDLLEALNGGECPLTGFFWDIEVINALKDKDMSKVLDALHKCIEYLYSDEGLKEMYECNDYEFYESGERFE
jgi:hypothetical protein